MGKTQVKHQFSENTAIPSNEDLEMVGAKVDDQTKFEKHKIMEKKTPSRLQIKNILSLET